MDCHAVARLSALHAQAWQAGKDGRWWGGLLRATRLSAQAGKDVSLCVRLRE